MGSGLGKALGMTASTLWATVVSKIKSVVNRGALNWSPSSSTSYSVPAGYYSGGTLSSAGAYSAGHNAGYNAGLAAGVSRTDKSAYMLINYSQGSTKSATTPAAGWVVGYSRMTSDCTMRLTIGGASKHNQYHTGGGQVTTKAFYVGAGTSISFYSDAGNGGGVMFIYA